MQKHHNLRAIDGVDLQNVARGNNSFDIYQAAKEQGVSPAYLSIINDTYPKLGIADFWNLFLPNQLKPHWNRIQESNPASLMQLRLPYELNIH